MPLHDFIFSNTPGKRLQRHLVFWLTWWLYFSFCDYLYQAPLAEAGIKPYFFNVGSYLLLKILLQMVVYSIACYPILYFLLPLVLKRKWLQATFLLLLVVGFLYVMTDLLLWNVFPYIDYVLGSAGKTIPGARFWPAVNLGLIGSLKIIASALVVKYVKNWWLKQKESERLDREKVNTELRLLKAQVHPDFLFKTLNNIYLHALSYSPKTPGMLLKLSDLLSYMLYECDGPAVPLEKELEMMKEYIQFEKIGYADEPETEVNIKGELHGKYIAPFLLLPFIENSFHHSVQMTEQAWINMDVRIEDENFSLKLANGVPEQFQEQYSTSNGIDNVQKRLILLYPGKHELKITSEQEMLIVLLNIQLDSTSIYTPAAEGNSFARQIEKSPAFV